jgi:hypothetical protein
MKARFFKASKLDVKEKATVSLSQLQKQGVTVYTPGGSAPCAPKTVPQDAHFVLKVDGVWTTFTVNREGKTAYTKNLPRHIKLPNVGKPTEATISDTGWGF